MSADQSWGNGNDRNEWLRGFEAGSVGGVHESVSSRSEPPGDRAERVLAGRNEAADLETHIRRFPQPRLADGQIPHSVREAVSNHVGGHVRAGGNAKIAEDREDRLLLVVQWVLITRVAASHRQ